MRGQFKTGPIKFTNDRLFEPLVTHFVVGAEKGGIQLDYIQPGKPQQNAYVERYNRTVRHEWLEMDEFATIEEAQLTATQWLWVYNK